MERFRVVPYIPELGSHLFVAGSGIEKHGGADDFACHPSPTGLQTIMVDELATKPRMRRKRREWQS